MDSFTLAFGGALACLCSILPVTGGLFVLLARKISRDAAHATGEIAPPRVVSPESLPPSERPTTDPVPTRVVHNPLASGQGEEDTETDEGGNPRLLR